MASPLEELVTHLAGTRRLELGPALARAAWRIRLDIDARPLRQPRLEPGQHCREGILPEWGIKENNVKTLARLPEILECIAVHQLDGVRADALARRFQRGQRSTIVLDHDDPRRAARSGLETKRSAAGEKVQAAQTLEPLPQPVEERLAHSIRRWTQSRARRHFYSATAEFTGDDPHFAFVRMHRSMVAALSWAARLKNGLARTREVLNTPVSELFTRRRVDESLFQDLETALLQADCGVSATEWLITSLREKARKQKIEEGDALKQALKDSLTELLSPLEKKLEVSRAKPYVLMIAGVNGSGKTTSIGKLAKWLQSQGKSVLLAAGDTFRAAAREQLIVWGERNNVPVIAQTTGDPGAVVFDALAAARARSVDVVIADTAGRLPTQLHLMEEIRKVKRVAAKAQADAPHEVLLVLDANTGQNAIAQVKAFDDALGLTGLVLTKLDGTAKGGVVCAIARERPIPLIFVGVGEDIDDLRPFAAREFAEALVG
jgi:fused signal recognition particle receptor